MRMKLQCLIETEVQRNSKILMFDDKLIQKQYEEYKENYVEPDELGRSMMRDRITEDLYFVSQMFIIITKIFFAYKSMTLDF